MDLAGSTPRVKPRDEGPWSHPRIAARGHVADAFAVLCRAGMETFRLETAVFCLAMMPARVALNPPVLTMFLA